MTDPRNPATVHFGMYDGKTLCGLTPAAIDGEHHVAVDFYDGDATCGQCNEAARERVETAPDAPEAPKCADCDALGDGPVRHCAQHEEDEDGCEGHESLADTHMGEIDIPAVTDAQRQQAREAAEDIIVGALSTLATIGSVLTMSYNRADSTKVDAFASDLFALASQLRAAAGHLRIADQLRIDDSVS